jgi:hypothetical protein
MYNVSYETSGDDIKADCNTIVILKLISAFKNNCIEERIAYTFALIMSLI